MKCLVCEKRLKYNDSTTSPLRAHLIRMHSSTPATASSDERNARKAVGKGGAAQLMHQLLGQRVISARRRSEIIGHVVSWCTGSLHPLSIVSNPGLVRLVQCLEPGYKMPSRTNIAALIRRKHELLQRDLVAVLKQVGGLAMTFDYWSSARNVSYGMYTGHFIYSAWVLRTVVLDTSEFSAWHTAVNICTAVQNVLHCCQVELGQLSGVVTGEAANMMAATRLLKTQEIA